MKSKNIIFLFFVLFPLSSFAQRSDNETVIEQWSGSCVAISNKLVATNFHVVDNAKDIVVTGFNGDKDTEYKAKVLLTDKINDLAVLSITDDRFKGFNIKYGINNNVSDIGTSIFVLGYPLTTTMGEDIKLTTGVISSKSGFQGNVSQYQISAAIQPGNSGGPLFDDQGNLIGIVSSKHIGAENVSYAIKVSYLRNLLESSIEPISLNLKNSISNLNLPNKVKAISSCVLMVKVSSGISIQVPQQGNEKRGEYEDGHNNKKYADIAHNYMNEGREDSAYVYYKKVDICMLNLAELNEFVRCCYFTGHFADALKASEAGLRQSPRSPLFNRLAMFSNYELKNYDAAKNYIYRYFNETDNAKFSEYDHYYAALIYKALNDYKNALVQFDKVIELTSGESMIKRWDILKAASDCCSEDSNYEKAEKYYIEFLNSKKNTTFKDWVGLGFIYLKWADSLTDLSLRNATLKKADKLYKNLNKRFPDEIEYITYMRANINSILDPDFKDGLAKPYYEKLAIIISAKSVKSDSDKSMLTTAWHYLMAYYFLVKKDTTTAKDYANKILSINPNYEPAQEMLNNL